METGRGMLHDIAVEAWDFGVGLTPLLPIKVSEGVTIFAKLEAFNRFKSVKDRAAFFMIKTALKSGKLDRNKTLIEASSGNTGIAIASIATALDYGAEIYVPEASSEETRNILKSTGAKIVEVSDENSKMGKININAAVKMVQQKLRDEPDKYVNLNQYSNSSNTNAHVHTTGPEASWVLDSLSSEPNVFVTGVGTGGTVTGMATFLKNSRNDCTVYCAEPDPNHHIQGLKNLSVSEVPEILSSRMNLIDKWITIDDEMANEGVRRIIEHGYFAGLSSGANFMAALKIASEMKHGNILTVFPDSAEKYESVIVERGLFTRNEFDSLSDDLLSLPEKAISMKREKMASGA